MRKNIHTTSRIDKRKTRTRGKFITSTRPRLSVHRTNKHIYAQVIDDVKGVTLAAACDKGVKGTKTERANATGKALADLAKKAKVSLVVFDRGQFAYHGRIKALAEGAREGGLQF